MRVLVVEDNPKMADAVRVGLEADGYAVDMCHTGFEGEDLAAGGEYDLIVLDLMLPDRDGVEVCRNLRRRDIATPVLMLTALSSTKSKVDGLDAGADDYLTKPFEFDELLARVRAMLRRGSAQEGDRLKVADVELDLRRRKAYRASNEVHLSAREFALLEFLMRNPDRVLSRTVICEKVWDMNYEPTSNVVDVYISALRRKMDRGYESLLIHTVIGSGYRFGLEESNSRSAG